ncbi:MAG: A24 family peptidase [Planctomycetaceae bacterium]|nr:A24 family peptidase [Planctomycetaceae bacterium]
MLAYIFCFFLGSALGLLASEFADRWGCSRRYRSPMPKKVFIALISGIAAAWLFWWEVQNLMLYQHGLLATHGMNNFAYQSFILHLVLFTFLLAATLTDFYEMIIPDSITVVGTLTALLLAVFLIGAGLPVSDTHSKAALTIFGLPGAMIEGHCPHPLNLWSPNPHNNFGGMGSLVAMTLLWWFWCFAMLDRVWYFKLPFRKAAAIFCRYLYRSPRTKYYIAAALLAPVGFAFVPEGAHIALLSALTGMAVGMVLIWGIRLVAQYVLGVEAMGFGDVTLMGMIGAFLGWQAVLLVFFLAPFFGLAYGIVNVFLGKGRAVPYGPFLCLSAVVVVIGWSPIWTATSEYFAFGIGFIGLALLALLALFGGLLSLVHKLFAR